ncbi:hypothetical protein MXZ33_06045 [Streptococcus uberis]|nr:hypothetical protein [Streptococcus uberis]MCK1200339.1 hypothetical protein [Streptococcus uberis]
MFLDRTVEIAEINGKRYYGKIKAWKELRELFNRQDIDVCQAEEGVFAEVLEDRITFATDENGYLNEELAQKVIDNFDGFKTIIEKFNLFSIFFEDESAIDIWMFILENMDDNWSKSPYSNSFYSSNDITWGYKPEGSLRVSDHWNFGEDGEHCQTSEPVEGWAVCKFNNGKYDLVKKF